MATIEILTSQDDPWYPWAHLHIDDRIWAESEVQNPPFKQVLEQPKVSIDVNSLIKL